MREKLALYLDAGAEEVSFCDTTGLMQFHAAPRGRVLQRSRLCPKFPKRVKLR